MFDRPIPRIHRREHLVQYERDMIEVLCYPLLECRTGVVDVEYIDVTDEPITDPARLLTETVISNIPLNYYEQNQH